jgi:archaellum component FlaD/FlaE
MIKELLDGLKSRLKGVGEKNALPPPGGLPPVAPEHATPMPGAPSSPGQSNQPPGPNPTPPAGAPTTEDFSALLSGGDTAELENKVKALEDKTQKLESSVKETLEISKNNATRLDSIDTNMKKFLSLYELVTNQINPFVDSKPPFKQEEDEEPKKEQKAKPKEKDPLPATPKEEVQEKKETPPVDEPQPTKAEPLNGQVNEGEQVMFMQSIKGGNASFVLEWITSLVSDEGGPEKNAQLLKYLLELGWITPKAYEALMQHIQTLAAAGRMAPQQQQMIPLAVGMPSGAMSQPASPNRQIPPSLQGIPMPPRGDDSIERITEWVKFLVDKVGYVEAVDVLKYMVQLEWITKDAYSALIDYINKTASSGRGQGAPAVMSAQPAMPAKMESKIVLSPSKIPTPVEFMGNEYRIPVSANNEPRGIPQPLFSQDYSERYPQRQDARAYASQSKQQMMQPPKRQTSSIIPLTEVGSDIESLAIILEWIRYLVDRAGSQGAKDIFNYYLTIGWVDQRVCQQLIKYVDGIKSQEEEAIGYQPTVEDHATSLFFISKLKHMDLSEEDISSMLGGR